MPKKEKALNFPPPEPFLIHIPLHHVDSVSLNSRAFSDVPSDIIIKSRIKYGGRWTACRGMIMEYSKSSSIHGIRYLFEVHRPLYEKLYWLILLGLSLYLATSLIWDTYLKWQDSPVILGFDETLVPVHRIPFPTITICPEIKTNRDIFNFSTVSTQIWDEIKEFHSFNNYENLTDEQLQHFAATLQICEPDVARRFEPYIPKHIRSDVAKTLLDLSVSKNETAPFCKWNGRFYLCELIFTYVATDEGICYQFNGLESKDIYRDARFVSYSDKFVVDFNDYFGAVDPIGNITGNWSLDSGYVGQGFNSYPQRTAFSSVRNGFFAFLQGFSHNFEYMCRNYNQGYKVFLNSPESVPLTTGNYILVSHGDEVMVSVLPAFVVSTHNLHDYSPEKRQCFFNDERYLRFFRYYSQSNCQTECLVNYTISICGCVKFWMPKPLEIPVCQLVDIPCLNGAQMEMNQIIQNQTQQKSLNDSVKIMCDCMPACTSLDYNFELTRARYDLRKTFAALKEPYLEHADFLGSRLSVYFKEHQFTAIKRTVLFSIATLIANCGGIFGLFMGISSLSLIELIYFFSVRLCHNLRKRHLLKKKLLKEEAGHEN